jgi:DinB superfamily
MDEGCHRVGRAPFGQAPTLASVELRTWIAAEHDGLRDRFDRAVAANVAPRHWRERAGDGGSSIAWLVFHSAWHEDLAMQAAVRGREPILTQWRDVLGLDAAAPSAGLGEAEEPEVTEALDLEALLAYADSVHDGTTGWLATADLGSRIASLAGVSATDVPWLHSMWTDKPVAWFLQWEAIGHRQGHLGEMVSVRSRLGLSPF